MDLTIKQLRYIETAARCGSIANAANEHHISPSSIAGAINALDRVIGFNLLERQSTRDFAVTPAGRPVLEHVHEILGQVTRFENELEAIREGVEGRLRIVCYRGVGPHLLPVILMSFARRFPNVAVDIFEDEPPALFQRLFSGDADIALGYLRRLPDGLDVRPLFQCTPFAILSANDPLAQEAKIRLRDLTTRPMIMLKANLIREYLTEIFAEHGLKLQISHSINSTQVARALLSRGHGYLIKAIWLREPAESNTDICFKPIAEKVPVTDFGLLTLAGMNLPKIAREFMDHCSTLSENGAYRQITLMN